MEKKETSLENSVKRRNRFQERVLVNLQSGVSPVKHLSPYNTVGYINCVNSSLKMPTSVKKYSQMSFCCRSQNQS